MLNSIHGHCSHNRPIFLITAFGTDTRDGEPQGDLSCGVVGANVSTQIFAIVTDASEINMKYAAMISRLFPWVTGCLGGCGALSGLSP